MPDTKTLITSTSTRTTTDDQALKARHRAMWALGDYHAVATELIADLGPTLVAACEIGPGQHVLDVAAGSGNVAIPAAATGAHVIATDLTPELLDRGEVDAAGRGLRLEWQVADAERLPFDDGAFDVVTSCVGVMFAPHHQAAADELVRVTRPGGRIGLISWTPAGFIGQLFATMKPFAPAPPPGAQPPPLWGDVAHLRELFADRITDVLVTQQSLRVDGLEAPGAFRDYFKSNYGPTIAAYRGIADQPERVAELDQALFDLAERNRQPDGSLEWEYLMVVATVV
ncbi:class I SAM-dependent methyltransferase [Nocardioides cynanchi]|uniref:class I SAM-dependent methyltransferase n=1 Tax=Nocardioides cynanchi TaxID=2558918 RepID=UPI0012440EE4|nr:class I SAM-dependent methyltransferase [Nocardioides cynanchi]